MISAKRGRRANKVKVFYLRQTSGKRYRLSVVPKRRRTGCTWAYICQHLPTGICWQCMQLAFLMAIYCTSDIDFRHQQLQYNTESLFHFVELDKLVEKVSIQLIRTSMTAVGRKPNRPVHKPVSPSPAPIFLHKLQPARKIWPTN